MENVHRTRGGPKPLFERGVIREVFLPPLFSTPPWRPPEFSLSFIQFQSNFSLVLSQLVNFSQSQSILVSFNQVTQDKDAEFFTERKVGQNCNFCPPTIWANSLEFSSNRLKLSADKMYRACELKDQTYKKTRTLHFSERFNSGEHPV